MAGNVPEVPIGLSALANRRYLQECAQVGRLGTEKFRGKNTATMTSLLSVTSSKGSVITAGYGILPNYALRVYGAGTVPVHCSDWLVFLRCYHSPCVLSGLTCSSSVLAQSLCTVQIVLQFSGAGTVPVNCPDCLTFLRCWHSPCALSGLAYISPVLAQSLCTV
jgi:hypothetical protein